MKTSFLLGITFVLLSGCMTLNNNKSVLVPPSDKATMVTSYATAHCQDYFFFEQCSLDNKMTAVRTK
jgi:hypothetical protein